MIQNDNRLGRSYLFVPADSRRKIEKAVMSSADTLILDLEDAVAPSEKTNARETVKNMLQAVDFGDKMVLVRVNALDTPFSEADLHMIRSARLDGIVLPKTEHVAAFAALAGMPPIYALIESALGILRLPQIVTAAALAGLMFGGEDYVASIGATATVGRQELLYARGAVINAAAAVGIPAIDTVFTDFRNLEGLQTDAEMGKQLGFAGKMVIHPIQVAVVNAVFGIDAAELAAAHALITAYEAHLAQGIGVFSYDGKMVDEAIIRRARQTIAYSSRSRR